jgi:hypothetical protein
VSARDHSGWSMVRCPSDHDPIGDCDAEWTFPTRAAAIQYGREIHTLPDIDHWEEQHG